MSMTLYFKMNELLNEHIIFGRFLEVCCTASGGSGGVVCERMAKALKFYIGATNAGELRAEFLNQMNIAWLYCPDDIIKKGYIFLDTVHTKQTRTDEAKEKAMGAFVAAIRQDILTRKLVYKSSLSSNDFIHIGITKL